MTAVTRGVSVLYVALGGVTVTPIQHGGMNTVHPRLLDGVWEERLPKQVGTWLPPNTDD